VTGFNFCPNYTRGSSISEVVFGANNEACGIAATETTLPDISFSLIDDGKEFKFFPYGERREDLFDIVYPGKNLYHGYSFFLDDPNDCGKSAYASLPAKQVQGLNPIDANGSTSGTHVFSSFSNQSQGDNSLLPNANNETIGIRGSYGDFDLSNWNQCWDNDSFFCGAGKENVGGNNGGSLVSSSPLNQQQETNPFMDFENEMKDDFSFPAFQWSWWARLFLRFVVCIITVMFHIWILAVVSFYVKSCWKTCLFCLTYVLGSLSSHHHVINLL